jgi:hypothetical protein
VCRAPRARIETHGDPRGMRGESAGAPRIVTGRFESGAGRSLVGVVKRPEGASIPRSDAAGDTRWVRKQGVVLPMSYGITIRPECLRPADDGWERPRGAEIQEVIRMTGLPGRAIARYLGMSELGGRQVRRWISEDATIPYSAWALLCDRAGLGCIWRPKEGWSASSTEQD